ncbi:hypothetical protein MAR_037451 [Mya arenaria]|uniref:Uncharacterized protein n=1 Tax=Mya arenaria TaxID=6604 RepID=A0ABY7FNS0_MYAAR|nr:hypothetical protein MAR_037451 [Mya arenaria]
MMILFKVISPCTANRVFKTMRKSQLEDADHEDDQKTISVFVVHAVLQRNMKHNHNANSTS